ncbi:MAG: hypothetical protein JSU68_01790 [Phycisphaerales bacterium]|nr:MAG: hypothetical protein JSU68_01790 [Phycisphaerales bacterium]
MTLLREVAFMVLLLCLVPNPAAQAHELGEADYRILQTCEGILRLFEQSPDAVWPGYNLVERPVVVYRPNEWALLWGNAGDAGSFAPYPSGWPSLGHPARIHVGPYENLAGQLVFDFPIGETKGLAIGLPDDVSGIPGLDKLPYEAVILGHIVHEAFHQFQNEQFGEIPWGYEEKYPILDAENSALACLEMHLLTGALQATQRNDNRACKQALGRFAAVRQHRWKRAGPVIENYERGLELREGTAKYVEVRAVESAGNLAYRSEVPADKPLPEKLAGLSSTSLLLADFETRLTDGAVSPDDMPRNRVYPVAAAQCLLLDSLAADWKADAQRAGDKFSYVELLQRHLAIDESDLADLVGQAKDRYGYDEVTFATNAQIDRYRDAFEETLNAFEAQPGQRLEVALSTNGLRRSRVSAARKWLMDEGRRSLCAQYEVYVLTRVGLRLQVQSSGVLELNDWETRTRTAICYVPGTTEFEVDGTPLTPEDGRLYRFGQISLRGDNVTIECSNPGTILRSGNRLAIDLRTKAG